MESWKAEMKSRWDEVKSEENKVRRWSRVRRKKMHPRQMLEKSRNAVFFQWFVCRVSRKVGSLKRRVRSHVVRGEIKNRTPLWREAHFEVKMLKTDILRPLFEVEMLKNGTPLWREAHFQVKMYKTRQLRTTFWSWDVEKLHAAVARSTFWSENAKKLKGSEHFLKLRCRKIARRCGAKHISK